MRLKKTTRCYKALFDHAQSEAATEVLRDLAHFCNAHDTTMRSSALETAALEGRRQVWLRIKGFINITDAELASYLREEEQDDEHHGII